MTITDAGRNGTARHVMIVSNSASSVKSRLSAIPVLADLSASLDGRQTSVYNFWYNPFLAFHT